MLSIYFMNLNQFHFFMTFSLIFIAHRQHVTLVVPKIWVRVGGHFECQRSVLGQKPSIQTQHPSWHCVATLNTKVKILDIFIITYLCLHIMIHMQNPYRIPCPTPVSKIRSVLKCDANKFPSEWSVAEFNQSVFHSSCLSRLKTKHFLFITPLC